MFGLGDYGDVGHVAAFGEEDELDEVIGDLEVGVAVAAVGLFL